MGRSENGRVGYGDGRRRGLTGGEDEEEGGSIHGYGCRGSGTSRGAAEKVRDLKLTGRWSGDACTSRSLLERKSEETSLCGFCCGNVGGIFNFPLRRNRACQGNPG